MRKVAAFLVLSISLWGSFGHAQTAQPGSAGLRFEPVVQGLSQPWSLAFLPDGGLLVTERNGKLRHIKNGKATTVAGVPAVEVTGQGGLLDVMVPRDFAQSRDVYLSFAKRQGNGAGTAVASGKLSQDGKRLTNVTVIFEATPGSSGGRHFGSRIVEGRDGTLFVTIGERGDAPSAQDLSRHNGSVIRINRDGTVPADNPFAGVAGAQPEIWSYGHRNPQGAALDRSGQLWLHEHGAQGGDEVNRVKRGANYGWPVISYGRHYSGGKIGEGTVKAGMEQPDHHWDPSIAPSGLTIYSGKLWPSWRGDFLVGSLKFDLISRLSGPSLREVQRIKAPQTGRVRDVREAPDGSIWFISEFDDTIYRMTPSS